MTSTDPGVTPEAASAPAAEPQSAPTTPAEEPKTLADYTLKLATQLKQKPPSDTPEAGQDSPPAEEQVAQQQPDLSQDEDAAEPKAQWPKSAVERVRKLKEQRKQARDEAEQLKAKLKELESKPQEPKPEPAPEAPKPDADDPLSHISDPDKIRAEREKAEGLVEQVEELLDDLHDDPEGVEAKLRAAKVNIGVPDGEWTPQAIKVWLKQVRHDANRVLKAAPKREAFLAKEAQAMEYVEKNLPSFVDDTTEDHKLAASVLKEFPDLKKRPDWLVHAAIYALGYKSLQAPKATPKAKTPPPAPRIAGTPQSSPRPVEVDDLAQASEKLKTGGKQAAVEYARAALRRGAR